MIAIGAGSDVGELKAPPTKTAVDRFFFENDIDRLRHVIGLGGFLASAGHLGPGPQR